MRLIAMPFVFVVLSLFNTTSSAAVYLNYEIYLGDLNADGRDDYYFHSEKIFVNIGGSMAFYVPGPPQFALYFDPATEKYSAPTALTLTSAQISSLGLTVAAANRDYFVVPDLDGNGRIDMLIQGESAALDSVVLLAVYNQLPGLVSVPASGVLTLATGIIRIKDYNDDGIRDLLVERLGNGLSDNYAIAYADGAGRFANYHSIPFPPSAPPKTPLPPQLAVAPSQYAPEVVASDSIGTTAGEFRVNESGAATYSIPIATAVGSAGVVPQITLNYSSQAGNGLVGQGWGIGGLSAITRCRQTLAQDGVAKAITWTEDDRYCLDGQRLVVNTGFSYGAIDATYKTEVDSLATITAVGGGVGAPDYFIVARKDGSLSYYGNGANATLTGAGGTDSLVWAINRFEDSIGNGIDFIYHNDSDGQRIAEIRYAYGSGSAHNAHIVFNYESRADSHAAYVAGYLFSAGKRLGRIHSYNGSTLLRQYTLEYLPTPTAADANKTSKLSSVQECAGSGVCLPKTTFTWELGTPGFQTSAATSTFAGEHVRESRPADIDGDGKLDLVWTKLIMGSASYYYYVNWSRSDGQQLTQMSWGVSLGQTSWEHSPPPKTWEVLDYNADGRQDVAVFGGGTMAVYLSTPQGDGNWALSSAPVTQTINADETQIVDLNADGLGDLFYIDNDQLYVRYLEHDISQPVTSSHYYHFGDAIAIDAIFNDGSRAEWTHKSGFNAVPDFNGDGRVDMVMGKGEIVVGQAVAYDQRYFAVMVATDQGFTPYVSQAANPLYDENYTLLGDSPTNRIRELKLVDLNSDGLTDLLYTTGYTSLGGGLLGETWSYSLNTGSGFEVEQIGLVIPNKIMGGEQSPIGNIQVTDYNLDGFPDMIWHRYETSELFVALWNGNGFDDAMVIVSGTTGGSNVAHLLMDVNGNAYPDYVKIHSGAGAVMKVFADASGNQNHQALGKITNGLGAETDIDYAPLSDGDYYERLTVDTTMQQQAFCVDLPLGSGSCGTFPMSVADADSFYARLNSAWSYPGHMTSNPSDGSTKASPVLEFNGATYVVTEITSSAPATTAPGSVDIHATSRVSYVYGEAKIQASGRGYLGFERIKSIDGQTGVATVTTYRQDFPFIGYPLRTEVRNASGNRLNSAENTWKLQGWDGTGDVPNPPYRPYIDTSVETAYHTSTDLTLADRLAVHADILQTVTTTNKYDVHGNATEITVTASGANVTATTSTVHDYGPGQSLVLRGKPVSYAELGRLTRTTVTQSRSDDIDHTPQVRTAAFTYYTNGGAAGLLRSEIIEPDEPAYTLTTTYEYDNLGNKTKATQNATGGAVRISESVYGNLGRYANWAQNAYGQVTEQVISRNNLGQSTIVADINGVQTHRTYGQLGRQYFQANQTGHHTQTLLSACAGDCPSSAVYLATTTQAGGTERKEYFDVLARTVRVSQRQFDGSWGHVDTEYDNLGRVKRKSEPHSGDAQYWTEFTYDILGRVVNTDLPGILNPVRVDYDGLTSVTTNPLSQTKTEVRNVLGELAHVYDHNNGQISYGYDAKGNLRQTTHHGSPTDPHAVVVEINYDRLGRKIVTNDPDKGNWSYQYNAFAELTQQVDAKGQTSTFSYDLLGRLTNRVDRRADNSIEGNTTWTYNTSSSGSALGALLAVEDSVSGYRRMISYDNFGRAAESSTQLAANDEHDEKTTFDEYGRVFQVFDAAGDGTWQDNVIENVYNAYGYLETVQNAVIKNAEQIRYYTVTKMDLRGNVTESLSNNGVTRTRTFEPATGRLTHLNANLVFSAVDIQNQTYSWDEGGNLLSRQDQSGTKNISETFLYDNLNRLTQSEVAGQVATVVSYNSLGNITSKTGVGHYTYGAGAGPHAVTSTADGVSYLYDANGNMTSDSSGRTIHYTTFDKPALISNGSDTTSFKYGPDRVRYLRTDINSGGTTTTRYIGSVEKIEQPDGSKEIKRYLPGGTLITIFQDLSGSQTNKTAQYLYKDHLGSVEVITDADGAVVQPMSFDAWGQRRAAYDWSTMAIADLLNVDHSNTTRGFTGHEMLDKVGLIHMNGRVYDPRLGRFIQADPYIQAPTDTQSYNRYTYVQNNPLKYTDPSGYFFTLAVGIIAAAAGAEGVVLAAIVAISAFAEAKANGATFSQAFFAGVIAGVSAGAFDAIGAAKGFAFLGLEGLPAKMLTMGTVGGITRVLQGGKFGHGFVSAGLGTTLGGMAGGVLGKAFGNQFIGRLMGTTVVGGTISEATGGKFANGAAYAAFQAIVQAGVQAATPEPQGGEVTVDTNQIKRVDDKRLVLNHLSSLVGDPDVNQGSLGIAGLATLNVDLSVTFSRSDIIDGSVSAAYYRSQRQLANGIYKTAEYASYGFLGAEIAAVSAARWAFMSASERFAYFGLFSEALSMAAGVDGSSAYVFQNAKSLIPRMKVYTAGKPKIRGLDKGGEPIFVE